jgi:hypothetical protein
LQSKKTRVKNDGEASIGWEQRERGRKQTGRLDTEERASHKKKVNTRTTRGLSTDKKNQIFIIYKEIESGAFALSYMRKGFLIYEKMRKYFPI